MNSDFVDYEEAAKVIGLPKGTLYSLVSRKLIPHIRLGPRLVRFSIQDLSNWISKHRVNSDTKTDDLLIEEAST